MVGRNVKATDEKIITLLSDIDKGGVVNIKWTTQQLRDARPELLVHNHSSFDRYWYRDTVQACHPFENAIGIAGALAVCFAVFHLDIAFL